MPWSAALSGALEELRAEREALQGIDELIGAAVRALEAVALAPRPSDVWPGLPVVPSLSSGRPGGRATAPLRTSRRGPGWRALVLGVLERLPGGATPQQLLRLLLLQGDCQFQCPSGDPTGGIRQALKRAQQAGQVERTTEGKWRVVPACPGPSPQLAWEETARTYEMSQHL